MLFKIVAAIGALAALIWMLRAIAEDLQELAGEAAKEWPVAANVALLFTAVPVMMLAGWIREQFARLKTA